MHPTTNNLQMIPAKADNHRNQPPAEHIGWFLTDVLLFTHLVHLPAAYASKTLQWIYALRSSKEISRRLGSLKGSKSIKSSS